ncbi:hypothetical protein X975_14508, partial [Stegodyphus mimosarum]
MKEQDANCHQMETLENGVSSASPSSARSQSICSEIVRIEQLAAESSKRENSRFSGFVNRVRHALILTGKSRKNAANQPRPDSFLEKFTSQPAQNTEEDL